MSQIFNKDFRKFAEKFAMVAGKIILQNFKLAMKKEIKADSSPVTITDKKINSLLIREVRKYFIGHDIKGEEESYLENSSEYQWVCDPVDGTIPFSHGLPICTFSLALVFKGEPILGVAYDPFSKRLFSASKGKGAHLNGKRIYVNKKSRLEKCIGEYGSWKYAKYSLFDFQKTTVLDYNVTNLRLASFVYPTCLVACGELDFTIFPSTTAHDVAAVKIILEEAGGKTSDIFGKPQKYDRDINGAILSNGKIHKELVALVKRTVKVNKHFLKV